MEMLVVTLASLLAGFIDSIVGGGGLVLVPALFAVFPGAPPATLLGTNKAASVWGTAAAAAQFSRRVQLRWHALLPAAGLGFVGSMAGAWAVTVFPGDFLRRALPFILLAVLAYTLVRKDMGKHHVPRFVGRHETLAAGAVGLMIGAYDGFREKTIMAERFGAEPPWLDAYGATSVSEFFAVACEAYFVNRPNFARDFPEMLRIFDEFFLPKRA